MNCSELQNNILDYLYGEAAPTAEAASHLQSCKSCQAEWDQMAHTRSAFSQLPEVSPKQITVNRVLAYARSYNPATQNGLMKVLSSLVARMVSMGFNPAPVAMMVVLVLALVFVFVFPDKKSTELASAPLVESGGTILANDQALRERLLENPFNITSPSLQRLQKQPSSLLLGDFRNVANDQPPLMDSELPEAGLSIAEIEKKIQQRRRMLLESDADSLMMRGRRLKAMGRIDLALRDFETIYRFYPDYSYLGDVLMYRAQCFAFQGQYDKALESLGVYTNKYPTKKPLIQPMIDQLEAQKAQ